MQHFDARGETVVGIDNNMRRAFFGASGDTTWNLQRLQQTTHRFRHEEVDIRDRSALAGLFAKERFDLVVHCAAQPSHDKAREIPFVDFDVNAVGTLNLLEMVRINSPDAVFIHMSTNKVYGDAPNEVPLKELNSRWEYADTKHFNGISEQCRIDQSTHSLFGASKAAADLLVQEYGRYFGMRTGVFRGGCLTGPSHSGVELHGFLSYLVKVAIQRRPYTVWGYKGKQVRDNLHSRDVLRAFEAFARDPRPGEVYNLGGGRGNSVSVLEAIELVQNVAGVPIQHSYEDRNRVGDHICYISDLSKFKSHFPQWDVSVTLSEMVDEMVVAERNRLSAV